LENEETHLSMGGQQGELGLHKEIVEAKSIINPMKHQRLDYHNIYVVDKKIEILMVVW
jgi:hypothetical protein